jgi:hypothetical protein
VKIPNAKSAVVEREKIVDYLLNPAHRYGASKARFFSALGFQVEHWQILAAALHEHARQHDVRRFRETGFGPRYEVEGPLRAQDGRQPRVRTVWQMDEGQLAPRLITAYPLAP